MKIFIGIPTYNRKAYLENLANCMRNVVNIEKNNLYISDDCSSEFEQKYLENLFPLAKVVRNKKNLGADKNIYQLFQKFLASDEALLFICDSDLILHPDSFVIVKKLFNQTDGILSLLNSSENRTLSKISNELVVKDNLGAAGVIFSREMVEKLFEKCHSKYQIMWDWHFSLYMKECNKRLMATKKSYVFHTGIEGENANIFLFDYAQNYTYETQFEKQVIDQFGHKFIQQYQMLSDLEAIKMLGKKIFRKKRRALFAFFFGERMLLNFLVRHKKRMQRR